ncbi:MAG: alpha/beta hydrolase [Nocardia sp.]|uniref:alpha/beta fold hydrolase n=1 Tax=Nocardia sp. TaxID=1821 RepID=UPI00261620A9|nr:alpha/beta hydrolase [Nocardia sp.]MCU1643969.1 alpha/beta hydrolase [Nocardia sp.]
MRTRGQPVWWGRWVAVAALIMASGCTRSQPASTDWVDGMRVEQIGTAGSPVILLPGSLCGPWEWRTTIEALRRHHHTVYAVAFPGFDGAPAPADTHDLIGRYTDEVVKLISTRRLVKPIVIGHSIGGTIALHIAAEHPDLVSGVIAVEGLPVYPGYEDVAEPRRTELADAAAGSARMAQTPDAKLAYARDYLRYVGVIDPALAEQYAPLMARSDFSAAAEYLREDVIADSRAELGGATTPIWEVAPYYQPREQRSFASATDKADYYRNLLAKAPNVTVVPIEPAKHFVMLDQPDVFTETIDGIVAGLFARAHYPLS